MRVARLAATAGLLVAAAGALGAIRAATRLDRLHVRTEAAWAALDAALYRRARAVTGLDSDVVLRCAAEVASRAGRHPAPQNGAGSAIGARPGPAVLAGVNPVREEVENELGRALAVLDRRGLEPAFAGRLADAEQRVVIARRIYNDAVRDTLALRSHPMVRWLRLAGTAAAPRYFEIAEPAPAGYVAEFDDGAWA